jgi:hypothetical protein
MNLAGSLITYAFENHLTTSSSCFLPSPFEFLTADVPKGAYAFAHNFIRIGFVL